MPHTATTETLVLEDGRSVHLSFTDGNLTATEPPLIIPSDAPTAQSFWHKLILTAPDHRPLDTSPTQPSHLAWRQSLNGGGQGSSNLCCGGTTDNTLPPTINGPTSNRHSTSSLPPVSTHALRTTALSEYMHTANSYHKEMFRHVTREGYPLIKNLVHTLPHPSDPSPIPLEPLLHEYIQCQTHQSAKKILPSLTTTSIASEKLESFGGKRVVAILGESGSGKSILFYQIFQELAKPLTSSGASAQHMAIQSMDAGVALIHPVPILIELSALFAAYEPALKQGEDLLAACCGFYGLSTSLIEELKKRPSVFLLDGLDELLSSLRGKSTFPSLVNGELLKNWPNALVIVSSNPCVPVDMNMGLSSDYVYALQTAHLQKNQVKEIVEAFNNDSSAQNMLRQRIEYDTATFEEFSVPQYLALLLEYWKDLEGGWSTQLSHVPTLYLLYEAALQDTASQFSKNANISVDEARDYIFDIALSMKNSSYNYGLLTKSSETKFEHFNSLKSIPVEYAPIISTSSIKIYRAAQNEGTFNYFSGEESTKKINVFPHKILRFRHVTFLDAIIADLAVQKILGRDQIIKTKSHRQNLFSIVSIQSEHAFLFIAQRLAHDLVKGDDQLYTKLINTVKQSEAMGVTSIGAAGAITILNYARVSFSGMDLRNISIHGADLTRGYLQNADLTDAKLTSVNLQSASLSNTVMNQASFQGAEFGQLPFIDLKDPRCVVSVNYSDATAGIARGLKRNTTGASEFIVASETELSLYSIFDCEKMRTYSLTAIVEKYGKISSMSTSNIRIAGPKPDDPSASQSTLVLLITGHTSGFILLWVIHPSKGFSPIGISGENPTLSTLKHEGETTALNAIGLSGHDGTTIVKVVSCSIAGEVRCDHIIFEKGATSQDVTAGVKLSAENQFSYRAESGSFNDIVVCSPAGNRLLKGEKSRPSSPGFFITAGSVQEMIIFSLSDFKVIRKIPIEKEIKKIDVQTIQILRGSIYFDLVTAQGDGSITIQSFHMKSQDSQGLNVTWDIVEGSKKEIKEHKKVVRTLTYIPKTNQYASSDNDKCAYIWSHHDGAVARRFEGLTKPIISSTVVNMNNSSVLVAASQENKIYLWVIDEIEYNQDKTRNQNRRASLSQTSIQISECPFIRIRPSWVAFPNSHTAAVNGLHIIEKVTGESKPEDALILSGSSDRNYRLWSLKTGICIHRFAPNKNIVKLVCSAQIGNKVYVAAVAREGFVNFVDAWTGLSNFIIPTIPKKAAIVVTGKELNLEESLQALSSDPEAASVYCLQSNNQYAILLVPVTKKSAVAVWKISHGETSQVKVEMLHQFTDISINTFTSSKVPDTESVLLVGVGVDPTVHVWSIKDLNTQPSQWATGSFDIEDGQTLAEPIIPELKSLDEFCITVCDETGLFHKCVCKVTRSQEEEQEEEAEAPPLEIEAQVTVAGEFDDPIYAQDVLTFTTESQTSTFFCLGSRSGFVCFIKDCEDATPVGQVQIHPQVRSVKYYAKEQKLLTSGSDGTIKCWSVQYSPSEEPEDDHPVLKLVWTTSSVLVGDGCSFDGASGLTKADDMLLKQLKVIPSGRY